MLSLKTSPSAANLYYSRGAKQGISDHNLQPYPEPEIKIYDTLGMDPQPPPPRPDSPPRRLRACAPCTRAKARCNFREENARRHLCDR